MNMVALLMRPWIMKMKENGIEPRTLADDLFFFANGKDHEEKPIKGMEISLQFFQDIGAKVAKNKCFMTSSCEKTRKSLRGKSLEKKRSPCRSSTSSETFEGTCAWISANRLSHAIRGWKEPSEKYIGSS